VEQMKIDRYLAKTGKKRVSHFVFGSLAPLKPTIVFDTFWRFAAERQNIFFKKLAGEHYPWTVDPILRKYKFTNAYRACDRVSQYLIRNVIQEGVQSPEEIFFRILLFKVFNSIETWKLLKEAFTEISYHNYSFLAYDMVLTRAMKEGRSIFSAAYIMPSDKSVFNFKKKHRNYLRLIERMIEDDVPQRLADITSMKKAFELLLSYPMIGNFLAYQFITDINYSGLTNFSEMEFVIPGPGARDGIRKCFSESGGLSDSDIIRLVTDRQQLEFERRGIKFKYLYTRPLQLIDCQNLFCEIDKYSRIAHPEIKGTSSRQRIKHVYRPNGASIQYWFPPKWRINDYIKDFQGHAEGKSQVPHATIQTRGNKDRSHL